MQVYMLKIGGVLLGLYSTEKKAEQAAELDIENHYKGSVVEKNKNTSRNRHITSPDNIIQEWFLSPRGIFYTISIVDVN